MEERTVGTRFAAGFRTAFFFVLRRLAVFVDRLAGM
jgi:hypothetical protein